MHQKNANSRDRTGQSTTRICSFLFLPVLLLALLPAGARSAEEYEQQVDLKASALLSPELRRSELYTIDEAVKSDGLFNHYTVRSEYGVFSVISTRALTQLTAELHAVAQMRKVETEDTFTDSMIQSGKNTVDAVGNLITDPQKTLEGAAAGLNSLFNRATQVVGKRQVTAAEDSKMEQFIGKTKSKGVIASRYGVSIYSLNPILQTELDRLAWADYAGGIGVGLAQSVIPGVGGLLLTTSGTARLLNEVINTTPASELWVRNRKKLVAMGFNPNTVELFLNHPAFSPALQTLMTEALEVMAGVATRDLFVTVALQANNHRMASVITEMATMTAGYHKNVAALQQLTPLGRILSATTTRGDRVVIIPVDHLLWRENVADAVTWLMESTREQAPGARFELWVLGDFSQQARTRLESLGWQLYPNAQERLLPQYNKKD